MRAGARPWALRRWAAVALLALPAGGVFADLDIDVPAGRPLEWPLPRPTPLRDTAPPVTGAPREPSGPGSVEVIGRGDGEGEYHLPEGGGSATPFVVDFGGITTSDVTFHLPWVERLPEASFVWLGRPEHASRLGWRYAPDASPRLHWLCVAQLLRYPLHPAVVSGQEVVERLIEVGDAAGEVCRRAQTGPTDPLARRVVAGVGPASPSPPVLALGGLSVPAAMIERLVYGELLSTHPHDPERRFAPRLLLAGPEVLPALLRAATSTHPLLRRNAVAALARHADPRARAALRGLLGSPDRVARNRAISGLIAARDRDAVPALVGLLGPASDAGTRVVAAHALGELGDGAAFAPLSAYLAASLIDVEAVWAALAALTRIPVADEPLRSRIADIEQRMRADRDALPAPRSLTPLAAHKVTRAEVVAEMCRLWRAAHGEAAAADELFEAQRKGRQKAGEPASRAAGPPRRRGKVLYGLTLPNLLLAVDVIARLGSRGTAVLRELIEEDTGEALSVRIRALERIDLTTDLDHLSALELLARWTRELKDPHLRAVALRLLAERDPDTAPQAALELLELYARDNPSLAEIDQGWAVALAVMQLRREGSPARLALLTRVFDRVREERRLAEKKRDQAARHHDTLGPTALPLAILPPALEATLLALARTGHSGAVRLLALALREAGPARAEAALGLGELGGLEAADALFAALADADPFVRFSADRALRRIVAGAAPPPEVDWLDAPAPELRQAVRSWQQALRIWAGR